MKVTFKGCMLFLIALSFQLNAFSQYQIGLIPRSSPDKSVSQTIGNTEINIEYGSPSVNNRQVWGDLLSYNEVWRAGANDATTVEIDMDIIVSGQPVTKGRYSLFVIPRTNDKWTMILNSESDQWGPFKYEESKDVIRVDVLPQRNNHLVEDLKYSISQTGFQFGEIILEWEYVRIGLEFETDYISQFQDEVASRVAKAGEDVKWVVYLQGAEHLVSINTNLDIAKEWLDKSESASKGITEWNKQFYPQEYIKGHRIWTRAKLLALEGNYKEATSLALQVKGMGEKSLYYNRKNGVEKIDALIAYWSE